MNERADVGDDDKSDDSGEGEGNDDEGEGDDDDDDDEDKTMADGPISRPLDSSHGCPF